MDERPQPLPAVEGRGPGAVRPPCVRGLGRSLAAIVVASGAYGFSAGLVHSSRLAIWNVAKVPLLILSTCAVCALAWIATVQFVTRKLDLRSVAELSSRTFADLSLLLASIAPVCAYLALTIETGATNFYEIVWHAVAPPAGVPR